MRILLVTRNLPPLVGGMERLNWHLAEELAKIAEVRVVAPVGSAALAPPGVTVREASLNPLWQFLLQARRLARREARAWRPGLVLAGSGLTAPLARSAARAAGRAGDNRSGGTRTAVYVHGLDVAVQNLVYRAIWLPAIRRCDRVIANSRATAELCRGVGVRADRIGIVHPGVDLPGDQFVQQTARTGPLSLRERGGGEGPDPDDAIGNAPPLPSSFRTPRSGDPESSSGAPGDADALTGELDTATAAAALPQPPLPQQANGAAEPQSPSPPSERRGSTRSVGGMPSMLDDEAAPREIHGVPLPADAEILLSVGRLSDRKGLREFVTQALPRIVAARPGAMLLVVGDAPSQALHAKAQTPAAIQAAADAAGVGRNLKFLGTITDYDELGRVYRAAAVHVFPVREIRGDPEGFGMVAVEAAAHGLPTVAFATGGVIDAVAEGQSGRLVPPGDYAAFASAVIKTLASGPALRDSCIAFARQFAWPAFGTQVARELGII